MVLPDEKRYMIEGVAFIGRTFDEYCRMFDLTPEEMAGKRILDCPAGACSFTAELNRSGVDGTAADLLYGLDPDLLEEQCRNDMQRAMGAMAGVEELYNWDFYKNVEGLTQKRREAYTGFIADYRKEYQTTGGAGRYIHAELPCLPFDDNEFALVLSAHFLFLYDDRFDYDFHLRSIREMLRVAAQEVRIFPLVGFGAKRSIHLERIIEDLRAERYRVEIVQIPFEFQKSANQMLRILKAEA